MVNDEDVLDVYIEKTVFSSGKVLYTLETDTTQEPLFEMMNDGVTGGVKHLQITGQQLGEYIEAPFMEGLAMLKEWYDAAP